MFGLILPVLHQASLIQADIRLMFLKQDKKKHICPRKNTYLSKSCFLNNLWAVFSLTNYLDNVVNPMKQQIREAKVEDCVSASMANNTWVTKRAKDLHVQYPPVNQNIEIKHLLYMFWSYIGILMLLDIQ